MDTLPFLVLSPEENDDGTKAIFSPGLEVWETEIPIEKLRENMKRVCEGVMKVFKDIKPIDKLKLKELELAIEISSEGGVTLVGTAKVGAKGAIKLKFSE